MLFDKKQQFLALIKDEFSIKSKNFVEIKAFENFKLAFTTVNEDFKFSSNAEIGEIGLFRLDSKINIWFYLTQH